MVRHVPVVWEISISGETILGREVEVGTKRKESLGEGDGLGSR